MIHDSKNNGQRYVDGGRSVGMVGEGDRRISNDSFGENRQGFSSLLSQPRSTQSSTLSIPVPAKASCSTSKVFIVSSLVLASCIMAMSNLYLAATTNNARNPLSVVDNYRNINRRDRRFHRYWSSPTRIGSIKRDDQLKASTTDEGCNNAQQQQLQHITLTNRRQYNFTAGVCCIVKDEEPYLMEWIDYQLLVLEFDGVYIFDNSPQHELRHWYDNSRNHPLYKKVIVIHKPGAINVQKFAYRHCIMHFGTTFHHPLDERTTEINDEYGVRRHEYIALLDIDEFIVLKQHESLHGMTKESIGLVKPLASPDKPVDRIHDIIQDVWITPPHMGGRGCLLMNWMMIGYGNKTAYSPLPVLKRFQYRENNVAHYMIKSLVYAPDFASMENPHSLKLKKPTATSEREQVQIWNMAMKKANLGGAGASLVQSYDKEWDDLGQIALIYHTRFTSLKEYLFKRCYRQQSSGRIKGCNLDDPKNPKLYMNENDDPKHLPHHNYPFVGTILDDSPWRLLTWKVPKYRIFNNDLDWPDFHYQS